jgi:transposase-like protein
VFTLVDRGPDDRYIVPAKSADESTIRLLLANRQQELLTVYTDGFRVYDPLEEEDESTRNTSSTATENTLTATSISTPARATRR